MLGEATGKRPTLYDPDGEGGELVAWSSMIERLAREDGRFGGEWWTFRALFLKRAVDPASFQSVEAWEEYVDNEGTRTADRRKGFLTLMGEIVKSQGELAIANWLALNGVPYEYERPYEYETADKTRRQYHPDFYLPEISTYIEHFAVDEAGNPPRPSARSTRSRWSGSARYMATRAQGLSRQPLRNSLTERCSRGWKQR